VITSSTSVINIHPKGKFPKVLDETVFSDSNTTEGMTIYAKSMILKEKAAWDFVNTKKEKGEQCPELVALLSTTMNG